MKTSTKIAIPMALAAAGASEPAIAQQQALFLDLETIDGDATTQNHEQQIEVVAWSWNLSRDVALGSTVVREIKISKSTDGASVDLMNNLITGAKIGKGILFVHVDPGGSPYDSVEVTMQNILITKIAVGAEDGVPGQTETIGLSFDNVCLKYSPDGKGFEEQCWDVTVGGKP